MSGSERSVSVGVQAGGERVKRIYPAGPSVACAAALAATRVAIRAVTEAAGVESGWSPERRALETECAIWFRAMAAEAGEVWKWDADEPAG